MILLAQTSIGFRYVTFQIQNFLPFALPPIEKQIKLVAVCCVITTKAMGKTKNAKYRDPKAAAEQAAFLEAARGIAADIRAREKDKNAGERAAARAKAIAERAARKEKAAEYRRELAAIMDENGRKVTTQYAKNRRSLELLHAANARRVAAAHETNRQRIETLQAKNRRKIAELKNKFYGT